MSTRFALLPVILRPFYQFSRSIIAVALSLAACGTAQPTTNPTVTVPPATGPASTPEMPETEEDAKRQRTRNEKEALLEVLRIEMERHLASSRTLAGSRIELEPLEIRVVPGWAVVRAVLKKKGPTGTVSLTNEDFKGTEHEAEIAGGLFDGPQLFALAKRKSNGWLVVAYSIGPTDDPVPGWVEEHQAPKALIDELKLELE